MTKWTCINGHVFEGYKSGGHGTCPRCGDVRAEKMIRDTHREGQIMKVLRIEVSFPVPVELQDDIQKRFVDLIDEICNQYEATHPGRVMWPFGIGSKITYIPMTKAEEEAGLHMEYDDDTFEVQCAERERYHRWFIPKGIKFECCRDCGIVKNEKNDFGECRGPVKIELRAEPEIEK